MTLTPPFSGRCHCDSCRCAMASAFTSFLGVRNGTWNRIGVHPAIYHSSPATFRDFHPTCRTQMAYRSSRWPAEMHFYAATRDDPTAFQPARHDHASKRLPWVHLANDLPQPNPQP